MTRRHDEIVTVRTTWGRPDVTVVVDTGTPGAGDEGGGPRPPAPAAPGDDGAGGVPGVEPGPRSFVWRGRRYAVCAVLDTWQERRAWWREVGDLPGARVPDTERRVWRVEARPPSGTAGVFDLGRDDDHWLLLRAHD